VVSTPDPARHANIMISMFYSMGDTDISSSSASDSMKPLPMASSSSATVGAAVQSLTAVDAATTTDALLEQMSGSDGGALPLCSMVVDGVEVDVGEEDLAAAFAFDED
jgi:hypothetical protein